MSGGFGGFGGFGQNNNNNTQQNTGFGGFGQPAATNTGFGAPANNTGFGATNNASTSLFGGTSTGFGNSGGFGSAQTSAFGAKPGGFGAPAPATTGGLFGSSTPAAAPTSFGGFGSQAANTATSNPFGSSTGGGLFGAAKPGGFGAATQPTSTPFGGASSTGFGAASTGFGSSTTALVANVGSAPGTGGVQFTPTIEKEPNSTGQNAYQSVCFQQPYQSFSPEELRVVDYAQGRKNANASGQAGAFGTNTGFGGFTNNSNTQTNAFGVGGAASTGMFGGTSAPTTTFGQAAPAAGGFGTSTGTNSLFGQKPAATGLFGNTQAQAQPSTSIFGGGSTGFGNATAGTGFGSSGNSLFGGANNTQAKTGGFSFNGAQPAAATPGFGAPAANTGTSGFGNTTGGIFGSTTSQPQNNSTTFGNNAQQQPASNPFGGFGSNQQQTSTMFGNNKPATTGLFPGATNTTTGGLFNNANNNQNNTTNPFGNSAANQGSNLFAPKPAATGTGGLFQNNTGSTNNGGGLFGNAFGNTQNSQTQQNTGGSLFNSQAQQQQKPSLFGNPPAQSGGGIFGNTTNTSSPFSGLGQSQQQQPQQPSLLGGSMFNNSQQNQTPQPGSLTASISDPTAFGTSSMFSNLASPEIHNPGPIATPLSSLSKQRSIGSLPLYKMNPSSSSRFNTPQKRGATYGFTYSTYGTPNSVSSTSSTPLNFGNSMLGSGLGQRLSKSVSTSSLRNSYSSTFNPQDSILAPGAFSASSASRYNTSGSMKKLVINRGLRVDLFSPPPKEIDQSPAGKELGGALKKRVSFDSQTIGSKTNTTPSLAPSSPLKQVQSSATPSAEEMGYLRSSTRSSNGSSPHKQGNASQPEMEQVKGNELAIVHEEEVPAAAQATQSRSTIPVKPISLADPEPGQYWMSPPKEEILDMNRMQRAKVTNFTVGREGVGNICFGALVDLSAVKIEDIIDNIVTLNVRSATVYSDPAKKPPMGKGLNVPAIITLENSWPRGRDKRTPMGEESGRAYEKHVSRLKRVPGTRYLGYNGATGIWRFEVEHFTTYGLDYDSDDETVGEGVSEFGHSVLSAPPDTPTPSARTPGDISFATTSGRSGDTESDPEDTFDFKRKKVLPGAFDNQEAFVEDDVDMHEHYDDEHTQSFLDERSAGSQSEDGVDEPMEHDDTFQDQGLVRIEDQEIAGSYPRLDGTAGHQVVCSHEDDRDSDVIETPGGAMRARLRMQTSATPKRKLAIDDDDWVGMLQKTVSPRKQDREHLKQVRDIVGTRDLQIAPPNMNMASVRGRVVSDNHGFATSMDLMHSLFEEAKIPAKPLKPVGAVVKGIGFEWPYSKHSKNNDLDESSMDENDRAFHDSLKPSWGPNGTLVYAAHVDINPLSRHSRRIVDQDGGLLVQRGGIISESRDVNFATFATEPSVGSLQQQKLVTTVHLNHGTPHAKISQPFKFKDLFSGQDIKGPAAVHEKLVWELASVLFDTIEIPSDLTGVLNASTLLRKDQLSFFWQKLVEQAVTQHTAMAKTREEKAVAALCGHRIADACGHLVEGKDFRLATLVALIGGNADTRTTIKEQLKEWQQSRVLSEISQPIRTIYEMLAGNVCVCDGAKGLPLEDRIATFVISHRFGLDWRQAFGLRLWYGILSSDDLGVAVINFAEDLEQEKESSKPSAWYFEQGISPLWEDKIVETREDLLWGLLKLYSDPNTDLEAVLRPENSQLSPLNVRLSWQLSRALTAFNICSYGTDADEKADQLTLSFASQLANEGDWLEATFVLLHLSSHLIRAKSIQDHLAQNAGKIGSEDDDIFSLLVNDYKVPASWIWEAKALYMRSVLKDPRREVECLLSAQSFDEAHRTFSKDVAPKAVIERDWPTLKALLSRFRGKETNISEWHLGGEPYMDYLNLVEGFHEGKIDQAVVGRLVKALPAMIETERHPSFFEMVAVQDISGVVAKMVVESQRRERNQDASKILGLPLTEDKYLKHSADLSLLYYRAVLAGS